MEYCIYLRKSRADDEMEAQGTGDTLARHEIALLGLAVKQKLPVTKLYREVKSGDTIAARPVMQELLNEVEQGVWAGVLVMEVERLARGDTIDQGIVAQAFKYSNTKIITPIKTYDPTNEFDEEYFEFGLYMSRREYKTINRRLQRGRLASINEGKYVGNKPPYGYERTKLQGEKGFTLSPIAGQAELITLIFEYYTIGQPQPDGSLKQLGTAKIADYLNELHADYPTNCKKWAVSTITSILRNPTYIGKIKWAQRPSEKRVENGKIIISRPRKAAGEFMLVDGIHPPLVSNELFEAAQSRLAANTVHRTNPHHTLQSPLAGVVYCGACGHSMVRRPYTNGYADSLMCPTRGCKNASSSLSLVEARILQGLQDQLERLAILSKGLELPKTDAGSSKKKLLNANHAKLSTLQTQLNNLYDLLEQGLYSKELFLQRSKLLTEEIAALSDGCKTLQGEIESGQQDRDKIKNILPKIQHVLAAYSQTVDPEEKNDLLKSVITKAIYQKEHGGRWKVAPDDFVLEIYLRM